MDERAELGRFLRTRREATMPSQVGLPDGPTRRRTPGLRREEVAMLAGVSVTWYTWLEQGRRINASGDVLRSIGRVLRLDDAGLDHLLALARPAVTVTSPPPPSPGAPAALVRLIDSLEPSPAYVLGPCWEFLARNAAHTRLYPDLDDLPDDERNLLWAVFVDPAGRTMIVDRDLYGRQLIAEFRAATTSVRSDPGWVDLVRRLRERSTEFATWWAEHDVAGFETRIRRFDHPAAGLLTFQYQQLAPVEWPHLRVACLLPVPGDDSCDRLAVRHYLV
ncbi:MAG: helix-turn-helix transcriptional regulator [Ilumatobacteraceae bacterium]